MADLNQFDSIMATFTPRRTDDLKPDMSPPVGWRGMWEVCWQIDEGRNYAGEYACSPLSEPRWGWVPSGDLSDIEGIDSLPTSAETAHE